MKTVLVISGGGIWGVMPADSLSEIESYLKKPIHQLFDMIVGESTGAILGAQLAAGVSAPNCESMYVDKGKAMFIPRSKLNPFNWSKEKYDRKPILDEMSRSWLQDSLLKNGQPLMKDLKTDFMCGSVSIVDERNHLFKSWEDKDGQLPVSIAVARSFAAAYYFGAINDPAAQQVWADGGEGMSNLPLMRAYVECKTRGWLNEGVYILAIGCGFTTPGMPYSEAAKMGWVGESEFYLNLARRQAVTEQVYCVNELMRDTRSCMDYVDYQIPKAWDSLDAVDHIQDGVKTAMTQFPPYASQIISRLKNAKNL